jgi:hypothetical protein
MTKKAVLSKGYACTKWQIHEKNVRIYLNQLMDNEKILERLSEKQRDRNAKYAFKKL